MPQEGPAGQSSGEGAVEARANRVDVYDGNSLAPNDAGQGKRAARQRQPCGGIAAQSLLDEVVNADPGALGRVGQGAGRRHQVADKLVTVERLHEKEEALLRSADRAGMVDE